jgi:hypothetical protein
VAAPREVLDSIRRVSRVEVEREGEARVFRWSLSLEIPFRAFFDRPFHARAGMQARANFYKCGDVLPVPPCLSWNPVSSATPDFHRPECFGLLSFA